MWYISFILIKMIRCELLILLIYSSNFKINNVRCINDITLQTDFLHVEKNEEICFKM